MWDRLKARNLAIAKDKYPNWPAIGTIGFSNEQLQKKYKLSSARINSILQKMRELR